MALDRTLDELRSFFDERATAHGATVMSVDWNSLERQETGFRQLLKIWLRPDEPSTVLDFGCGYGALLEFLCRESYRVTRYTGYDFSEAMIRNARELLPKTDDVNLTSESKDLRPSDFVIASGVLGMKLDATVEQWTVHCLKTLDLMWELAEKGLAFNSLTSYSDADKMRDDLYYADPKALFDYCKRRFSRNVALLHDYGLYEFTILVRR